MKVKLQSDSKLRLVKAVYNMTNLSLKEAKDLVNKQTTMFPPIGVGLVEFFVFIDSERTEEQIKTIAEEYSVTYTLVDSATTVKITSAKVDSLLDAVMKLCQLSPKEASGFIRSHTVYEPTCKWICASVDGSRKEIEMRARNIKGIEIQFLDNVNEVQNLNVDTAAPESANYHEAEQKLQKAKLQEVTDEDLGVSIHSIDKMSIGWQRKALFSHEQATRVMAGLHDAKFNVTEANVMYEGQKTTMLVVTKTFPTGTRKKDLEKFEELLHTFISAICGIVDLEERIERVKELAIEAFNELQDYE